MTLDELTTPMTVEEVKTSIYTAIAAQGVDVTTWKEGAPTRTMIAAVAIVLAAGSKLQSLIAQMGFLALSQGEWLTQVALYVYGVERSDGTFATGEVTLTNTGGGVYAGDPGDLIFINTTTEKTYRNTAAFSIAAFEPDVIIPIQAIEIGSASNAQGGEIDDFETPLLGVTVTNADAVVGLDAELDAALVARCNAKTGILSPNGPADAYAYLALAATDDDGTPIGVTRVRTVPLGDGVLDVYVADATGEIADSDDLDAIDELIQTRAVPLGITANVLSATPITVPVTYELWIRATSITDAAIREAVEEALTAFMASQPIGGIEIPPDSGKVYVSAIETVIGAVRLADVVKIEVTAPAADVGLATGEAPALGTVTCTAIHQVVGGLF
jgi:phage-related baseplate assembly protein